MITFRWCSGECYSLQKKENQSGWIYDELFIPVHIVMERVVAAKSNKGTQTQTIREENLCCSIQPNLRFDKKWNYLTARLGSTDHSWITEFLKSPQTPLASQNLEWYRTRFHHEPQAESPHGWTEWTAWNTDRWQRSTQPASTLISV